LEDKRPLKNIHSQTPLKDTAYALLLNPVGRTRGAKELRPGSITLSHYDFLDALRHDALRMPSHPAASGYLCLENSHPTGSPYTNEECRPAEQPEGC
jgi:hypothetical protein